MRSYTSLMSKIHLHTLTEYCSLHKYLPDFQQFSLRNKSQHIPLTALFWKERPVKKIQCDGRKALLRTLLLLQGRTAEVGLVLLALIHLLAGTDSKDERKGEVCLFQVNMPPGLPTHPKQMDLQESWPELVNACTMIYLIYLFILFFSFSASLRTSFFLLRFLTDACGTMFLCIPSSACHESCTATENELNSHCLR